MASGWIQRSGFPGLRALGLPFALGAGAALGQAPLGLWPVALACLAVLLRHLSGLPARRAAWGGWAAGTGHFILALNWIISPFLVDAPRHGWMAPFALGMMASGLALFWALGAGLGARLGRGGLAGLVAGLTAAEMLRGHVLTGFPWALPGHVWIDTPVAQWAALFGAYGLTLATLALAALAAPARPLGLGLAGAALALLWGVGLWQLSRPEPAAPDVTLRLVQPNAAQEAKWDPDQAALFMGRLMDATAAPGQPDLVIWPETALPYLVAYNPEIPALIGQAGRGALVAVGLQRVEGERGWNSLQVFGPGGEVLASYDKHHLVPFGEYVPLADLAYDWFGLTAFASQIGGAYSAGPGPQVLDLGPGLGHVLPLICYEAVFPQDLRAGSRPDWLLQVTNDAWFGTLTGPFQHAAQARLRAVEQGLPLVRVANTGVTQVVDARGRVTAGLDFGTQGFLDAALPGPLPATPYANWGEAPALVLLAGCAALALARRRRPFA